MNSSLHVLFEDNHCLAVAKPARVPTAGDDSGDDPILELARRYVAKKYAKPGAVFLGVVHRLDRPVSGVLLLARTSKAASRLSEQFREGRVRKTYRAVVEGLVEPGDNELVDWLLKDRERNLVRPVAESVAGAQRSVLRSKRLRTSGGLSWVELRPETGRSHQIRVQLASRACPIVGDSKYGATRRLDGAIALHACELTFEHPTRREPVTVVCPMPPWWETLAT